MPACWRPRNSASGLSSPVVIAGHSPSKTGVNALVSRQSIFNELTRLFAMDARVKRRAKRRRLRRLCPRMTIQHLRRLVTTRECSSPKLSPKRLLNVCCSTLRKYKLLCLHGAGPFRFHQCCFHQEVTRIEERPWASRRAARSLPQQRPQSHEHVQPATRCRRDDHHLRHYRGARRRQSASPSLLWRAGFSRAAPRAVAARLPPPSLTAHMREPAAPLERRRPCLAADAVRRRAGINTLPKE